MIAPLLAAAARSDWPAGAAALALLAGLMALIVRADARGGKLARLDRELDELAAERRLDERLRRAEAAFLAGLGRREESH